MAAVEEAKFYTARRMAMQMDFHFYEDEKHKESESGSTKAGPHWACLYWLRQQLHLLAQYLPCITDP